jgi:hypothetical protein
MLRRSPLPPEVPPGSDGFGSGTLMSSLSLTNGQDLTIASDAHYVYDLGTSPAIAFGDITVNGKLSYSAAAAQTLTAKSITNNGKYVETPDGSRRVTGRKVRTILNGAEVGKVNAYMVDETAASAGGNGVLKRLWQSTSTPPTADETITVTWTSATNFNVSGTVSGANFASGTVGTLFNNKVRFLATAGTTPWAAGNTRTLRVERKGSLNDGKARGVRNMAGAHFEFKGPEKLAWTRLLQTNGTLTVTGNVMPLEHVPTGWAVGDTVVVTTTDYYNYSGTKAANEEFTISAIDIVGKTVTLSGSLLRPRCGAKQYVTETGTDANGRLLGALSLTDAGYTPHVVGVPRIVDQRAYVLNLSREITFESADDTAWQDTTNGRFGVHIMNMGLESTFILDQVELYRCGQRGRHGRYAVHNHMPSFSTPDGSTFPSDGTFLGDVNPSKQYVKGVAINFSAQHGIQNHGACGWVVTDTVVHNCAGHAFNLEDGSELRYVFARCVASQVLPITASATLQLKAHETEAAGFWLTNLGGDCYDGAAINCGRGIWKSPAGRAFGLSRDVSETPTYRRPGRIENMTSMSHRGLPVLNGGHVTDERGAVEGSMTGTLVSGNFYFPTDNDRPDGNWVRPQLLKGFHIYKADGMGYFNRVGVPEYLEVTAADCRTTIFNGNVNAGFLRRALLCGVSLHNTSHQNTSTPIRAGAASYHNTQVNQDCLFINFPPSRPADGASATYFDSKAGRSEVTAGANQSADFYQNVIEQGYKHHTGCKFLSADPGVRSREWSHRKLTSGETDAPGFNSSLTPADKDYQGWWHPSGTPGWWRTLNLPYYTGALSTTQPVIMGYGGAATTDPYFVMTPDKVYGLMEITMETDVVATVGTARTASTYKIDDRISELNCWRLDSSFANVAQYVISRGDRGANGHYKRFIGLLKNQRYSLSLGITATPKLWSEWAVYNADDADDTFVIGIPWDGAGCRVFVYSGHQLDQKPFPDVSWTNAKAYTAVSDRAAVDSHSSATSAGAYWFDSTNKKVWIRYWGGKVARPAGEGPTSFDIFNQNADNRPNTLYIFPA